jgi:plastocyanin
MLWLPLFIVLMLATPLSFSASSNAQAGSRAFPETGKTVKGRFLEYWTSNGGLAQQGYPISEEMQEKSDTDGKTYKVQYFERSVFELHPENKAPHDVLLSLLGNFYYTQKYQQGAPNQQVSADNPRKFAETGKTVGGKFRVYWEKNGGRAQQGYPISEEFEEKSDLDGRTYRVQYFERAVFEHHPEKAGTQYEVLLSQLGKFRYDAKYGAPTAEEVNVDIVDFEFKPAEVTVKVGTKVTWKQVGPTVHNSVAKAPFGRTPMWESPLLKVGEKFSYVFNQVGTFDYLCTIHPSMTGKVIVK